MNGFGRGCVKTLFKSKFAANLPDFKKLQFAKALTSLKLKFGRLGFNHNLIRSLTFSHSLGLSEKSPRNSKLSVIRAKADTLPCTVMNLVGPHKRGAMSCWPEVATTLPEGLEVVRS
jgi:hypothetical protein